MCLSLKTDGTIHLEEEMLPASPFFVEILHRQTYLEFY